MFEGIDAGGDDEGGKRAVVSTGVSLAIYVVIGALLLAVGGSLGAQAAKDDDDDDFTQVQFKTPAPEPPKIEEPPPPPPMAPKPKRKKKSSKPAAAPVTISEDRLAEGSEKDFTSTVDDDIGADIATPDGDGDGDGGGSVLSAPVTPPPPPPPPAPKKVYREVKPVYVKENVKPPVEKAGNVTPKYPEAARKAGREALVILRVVVTASGGVGEIKVIQGAEPFLAAALAVVKVWQFTPARINGKPAPFHLLVRVPFRLKSA